MHTFFSKYPITDAELVAVKMIHKQIECAQESLLVDPTDPKYLHALAKAYEMLLCFLMEKGYNPQAVH